ncbi:MAG: hypothetical protein ABIP14_01850, partial [Blastocatellia bacterium]
IYFINVGPEGTRVIFPSNVGSILPVAANVRRDVALRLNNNVGREELILIVARERIVRLDEAISRPDKMLDATTTALPAAPVDGYAPPVVAVNRPAAPAPPKTYP